MKAVFLSSTSGTLGEYRDSAHRAINSLDGYKCIRMEDFGSRDALAADFCRAKVQECDVFVGIIGPQYGSSPEGSRESFTEIEYNAAVNAELPRLIFLSTDDFPVPYHLIEGDELRMRQSAFRERVSKERIRTEFTSSDVLAGQVVTAIRNWEKEISPSEEEETRERFVNRPPFAAPAWFQNRFVETGLVGSFLTNDALRMITVVGRAGVGKTAMICRLLKSLEDGRLPDDGDQLDLDGIVYLSETGSRRVNFQHFFADLCKLLPGASERRLMAVYKNAKLTAKAKMQALLEAFPSGRTVVLLDNFEDVLDSETGKLRDADLDEALRAILELPQHGLKIIITSRVSPRALRLVQPGRQMEIELDKGLESPYAENILRAMDSDGSVGLGNAPDDLLRAAQQRTRGYPRALEALFAILAVDRNISLEEILNDTEKLLPENVVQVLVGEAFDRLPPAAQQVTQALAVFTYPVPAAAVDFLLEPFVENADGEPVLRRLVNMRFARREATQYYLHPVDRAYSLEQIPVGGDTNGNTSSDIPYTRQALQRRGADYFRGIRSDESTWSSIDDLTPLMAEFELLSSSGDDEQALEVLYSMDPHLERWGQFRQLERMANRLALGATPDVQAMCFGLAGGAHLVLGEEQQAIDDLKEALRLSGPGVPSEEVLSWRLQLADALSTIGSHSDASAEYRLILDEEEEDIAARLQALLGLGRADEAAHSYADAQGNYMDALRLYVSQMTVGPADPDGLTLMPSDPPPDLPIGDPFAWYPLSAVEFEDESDTLYLFGVEVGQPDVQTSGSDGVPAEDDDSDELEVVPVLVTGDLPEIWMSFAGLFERTDQLQQAEASCRLALAMFGFLDDEYGTAGALGQLRRLVGQVSEAEAGNVLAAQEDNLRRARKSRSRRLEVAILSDLADSYLERSKIKEAEERYLELARHAEELEDHSLRAVAEIGLARTAWILDDADGASEKLRHLLQTGMSDSRLRSDVLLLLARIDWDRGHWESAVSNAREAAQGYETSSSFLDQLIDAERLLGSIAIGRRDYDEAVRRFEGALHLAYQTDVPSVIATGLCDAAGAYLKAGSKVEAQAAADEALNMASALDLPAPAAQTLMTVGEIQTELRTFDVAESAYKDALTLYRNLGDLRGQLGALRSLAWIYGLSEKADAQIQVSREALDLAHRLSDPSEVRMSRMHVAMALGDTDHPAEAIQEMEAVVAEAPTDALAVGNLGWILYQAGEYDRSLQESRRALEIDPTQTWVIRNVGHAYLAKGLPDDAEREYRRAISVRKGGENFVETIREVKALLAKFPDLPRGHEMLDLLEQEQQRLESE